jgi:predicted transcriptional regulator
MPRREAAMSKMEFRRSLRELGMTPYRIASKLGVSRRQCHRYASGETTVPGPVAMVLTELLRMHRNHRV